MDRSGSARPGRPRGFLGEMREAFRRGSAGPVTAVAPAGRAERLGLAPPEQGGSQAEALPSRIVHAGHRHRIGAELAGNWHGRAAVVFDLDLATDSAAGARTSAGEPGGQSPLPAPVIDWVGREVTGRRIGRYPISALELAGS
jgi:hypothetical protein